ncbi:MAG TPA: hypothetical protein VNR90_05875, partial [Vicinamibacterales bacterium]|nr:hypothetical protein [Vicinamibacterales bacterium]
TLPSWSPPPLLLWRDVAQRIKAAAGATLRHFEGAPVIGAALRWRFQRQRRQVRARRGLPLR